MPVRIFQKGRTALNEARGSIMFQIHHYEKADSVRHAIELLKSVPDARPIAGGTDVLIRLREGKKGYGHLVDINGLEELRSCRVDDDGSIHVGSGVTFSQAMESEIIRKHIPILSMSSATVGGPQIRNVATIGGNICNGVTSADSAAPLLTLNPVLRLEGPDGTRDVAMPDFYLGPGRVDLKHGELLRSIIVTPENYRQMFGYYYKFAMRNAMDIATIGCAASCKIEDDRMKDLRLAYGVAAPVPVRCYITEQRAIGRPLSGQLLDEIENSVENDVNPRTSWRASREFRLRIVRELARRVVLKAVENAGGEFK